MKKKLVNGQKLPPQYRTATLVLSEKAGETRAEIDDANRIVRGVSVSSDEPYERYYGTEILSHLPGSVDLDRVTSGASPLLYNHDRDALLGKVSNPQLRNGKLFVDFKFSQSEAGMQALADVKDGILTECSIGYDVTKFEVDEDDETYTALLWTLYECSLVTIPADFTVGVGRAVDADDATIEIVKKNVDDVETGDKSTTNSGDQPAEPQDMKKKFFLEADKGDNPTTGSGVSQADITKAKDDSRAEERKRVKDIQDLNAHFSKKGLAGRRIDTSALANQCIADGKTSAEFRDEVMVGTFPEVETVVTNETESDRAGFGGNGSSKVRVIGERSRQPSQAMSIGEEFVRSKEFQAKGRQTGMRRDVSVDYDIGMLGLRGKVAMAQRAALAQRAGFNSPDLAPVSVQIQPQVIGLGMQRLTVMDLLTGGATDAAAIIYPRENTFGTIDGVPVAAGSGGVPGMPRAKSVGERGLKPNWDPDLTTAVANVKKIAITTKVPDEFMADFPAAQSYIDGRLPFMVDTETEFQLLYGDGLGNNLLGIYSTSGILTRAMDVASDTTVAKSLRKGLTDIQVNSYFEPDGYVFHPYDWETASLLTDSQGRFLSGGPFYIPYTAGVFLELYTFWGKPVVKTTACAYGSPLAGCFKLGAQYFMREGMRLQMTNSNEDDFKRNLIALRAEHRLALAVYRPNCFLEFTGMPARV